MWSNLFSIQISYDTIKYAQKNLPYLVQYLYKSGSKIMKWNDNKSFDWSHKQCIIIKSDNKDSCKTCRSQYGICVDHEYDWWN